MWMTDISKLMNETICLLFRCWLPAISAWHSFTLPFVITLVMLRIPHYWGIKVLQLITSLDKGLVVNCHTVVQYALSWHLADNCWFVTDRRTPKKTNTLTSWREPTWTTQPSVQLDLESSTICRRTSHSRTCHTTVLDSCWRRFVWWLGPKCGVNSTN